MEAIRDGQTTNGEQYRSFVCSNRSGGCDFFETKYGDLTPPGIRITEKMTAQDVERLREERRNRGARMVGVPTQAVYASNPQLSTTRFNSRVYNGEIPTPNPPDYDEQFQTDDLPF